uniref:Reverse transcriptase Ty1/copia-type domain-containing protein n=1 Tax=Physcomitrium patens TaxID=3218 RepID=A0A2K1L419_PHYPA|nr:hypothetical protein PHYPA_003569 [Physcomitrium patens]
MTSLCLFLTLTIHYDFYIHQMDITMAFLNRILKEKIYIIQFKGFNVLSHKTKVCHLFEFLYGLKQIPCKYVLDILNYFSMNDCYAISTLLKIEIKHQLTLLSIIYCDNQSYITMIQNLFFHNHTKHIDIKYNYIQEKVKINEVVLKFISINDMKENIMTKSLQSPSTTTS